MIPIDRGPPPPVLARIQSDELRRVRELRRQGKSVTLGNRYNHRDVRAGLHAAQGAKCCYCEITLRRPGTPIEHHRPKGKALRGHGRPTHGYWWLAWDWNNLFLACTACNGAKSHWFPLSRHRGVLRQGSKPPGPERPLLLDPANDDPMKTIRFVRLAGRWRPIPRQPTPRAKKTIRIVQLDADDLLEHYDARVSNDIDPLAHDVEERMRAGDAAGVRAAWKRMRAMLFNGTAPFQALAYDVLDARFPRPLRAMWKVALPRP